MMGDSPYFRWLVDLAGVGISSSSSIAIVVIDSSSDIPAATSIQLCTTHSQLLNSPSGVQYLVYWRQ